MSVKRVRLSQLVFDPRLVEMRAGINELKVNDLYRAYQVGEKLPRIIVEDGTNVIVSGMHRTRAMIKLHGPNHVISVAAKTYHTRGDLLVEAAFENSRHGQPLSSWSRKLFAAEMAKEGVTREEMARAFCTTIGKVDTFFIGNVQVDRCTIGPRTRMVKVEVDKEQLELRPVKRHVRTDKVWSAETYENHSKHDLGLPIRQLADQITRHLRDDILVYSEANLKALAELKAALDDFFAARDAEGEAARLDA